MRPLLDQAMIAQAIERGELAVLLQQLESTVTAHAGTPPAAVKQQVLKLLRRYGGGRPWAQDLAATGDPGASR